ncbi:Uma2 family endonuclease [Gemmatimonas groenlandica]|uniref:Uma2 family endonuclease n=1 Tax=Gemmatimonas groenlandica TaxID=2732249 RepID=A0A6M4IKZ0_9BACT|nr:Uma2 family endonuclease [Gemmatimonas groenlandica]QJR34538.1 Uma2 family endonuclease [Gemmatimonas groenlandica]
MAMPALVADWTIEMLDALPDDGQRYELIDGLLHVTPSPNEGHQDVALELSYRLSAYFVNSDVGKVMISPSNVWRGERNRNRVQPDVYVVKRAEGKRAPYPYHLRDLLLAVEVVSPSNPLLDYQIKRDLYLREGVGEYWVVHPEARNVSRWSGAADPGEVLSTTIRWQPQGMAESFVLDLPSFFEHAFR